VAIAPILILSGLLFQTPPQEVVIHSHAYTPPKSILRAEASLVESELTVRDSRGHAIANLHASDFEIFDNGAVQKITAFSEIRSDGKAPPTDSEKIPAASVPPHQPKFVTFFIDDTHLDNPRMLLIERAAHAFIAKGLKPSDQMSIVTASGQGDLDFTNDATLFADKLDHLRSHVREAATMYCGVAAYESYLVVQRLDNQAIEQAISAASACACTGAESPAQCRAKALPVSQQLASTNWEQTQAQSIDTIAALGLAAKRLSEKNGTRLMVLTSSGFLLRPGETAMEKFVAGAVRWNIVVHALDAQGLDATASDLKRQSLYWTPLENVTDGTGGHLFKNTNDLAGALDLAANPEVTYLLAFNPGTRDGKFHTLRIKFKSKRPESVQFRPGYFSVREEPAKESSARAAFDAAVFSTDTLSEIPAEVHVTPAKASVSISVTVDMKSLQFAAANGRHVQQIVFLMTLLDSNGGFVTGKEAVMDLSLTDGKLESLKMDGLKGVLTLQAPAGSYQVRALVREAMKGNLAAYTVPVQLK
jgi:VWFA-related protein